MKKRYSPKFDKYFKEIQCSNKFTTRKKHFYFSSKIFKENYKSEILAFKINLKIFE
jgi:hypothetical protein